MWASCASDTRDSASTHPAREPSFEGHRTAPLRRPDVTLPLTHLPRAQHATATLSALARGGNANQRHPGKEIQVRCPRGRTAASSQRGTGCRHRGSAWKSDLPPPEHSSSCAARRTQSSTPARLLVRRESCAHPCTRVLGCSKRTTTLFHAVSQPLSPKTP